MPTEAEKRFIDAWRFAAPRLEEIRLKELRELDEHAGLRMISNLQEPRAQLSGLIEFQAWMMRLRVIQLQTKLNAHSEQS